MLFAPAALAHLHNSSLLDSASPFWRNTTSPYGPLCVAIVGYLFTFSAKNLVEAIILLRLVEVLGLMLTAYFFRQDSPPL